jgi:precorrin-6B methylase 2
MKQNLHSRLLKLLVSLSLIASVNCTNGQSYNNIYSEDNWEDRDEWQRPELIIEQLDLRPGENVADIGCHEGYMTLKLSEHVGDKGQVFAVDVNSYRLNRLRGHLEDRNIMNVNVIEGDNDNPNLPLNTLDAALIIDTYHEIDSYAKVLQHIRNALNENGRLVILEPIRDSLRGNSRSSQESKHEIGIEYVIEDLKNAGFRIIKEEDPFIDRTEPKGDNLWLLVAVKDPEFKAAN